MSVESGKMAATVPVVRGRPMLVRHLPYFICAAILVALAAVMQFDGYVLNILMQATTFSIAVFGLSVVLGLCGQINLAQAAFFGFGAYAVGIGTADLHQSFWLCLVGGIVVAFVAGAFLGASTLRLGGHYLAMVTISFQQIVTLVMINAIWLTHGPDGVSHIARPALFQNSQSYLAFCVAALAIVGYIVWHLPDTRLGRAMRAVTTPAKGAVMRVSAISRSALRRSTSAWRSWNSTCSESAAVAPPPFLSSRVRAATRVRLSYEACAPARAIDWSVLSRRASNWPAPTRSPSSAYISSITPADLATTTASCST